MLTARVFKILSNDHFSLRDQDRIARGTSFGILGAAFRTCIQIGKNMGVKAFRQTLLALQVHKFL